jgi:hypothetical protein
VHRAVDFLERRVDSVRGEFLPVNVLDGRIGVEQGLTRVKEDGANAAPLQGITWPPSITMA